MAFVSSSSSFLGRLISKSIINTYSIQKISLPYLQYVRSRRSRVANRASSTISAMSGQEGDVQYKLWYGGGKEIDDTIRNRFGSNVERALAGQLDYWVGTDTQGLKGALALTIILDQFPRSIYRGKSKAYAGDVQTRDIVQSLLQPEKWEEVKRLFPPTVCISFMLPLMHQESVEDLNTCYSEVEKMAKELEQEGEQGTKSLETLRQTLTFTVQHRDIVTKFGRYPYRNEALQRESSAEELQFLNDGPRFGQ